MRKILFVSVMILFFQPLYAASYAVPMGNERVIIQKEQIASGPTFVHLHQNEKTALIAARTVMHSSGGSLITLKHRGGRNIVFYLNHRRYEFDPNRIFTEKGIEQTLRRHGHYSKNAHIKVRELASCIKRLIPAEGKVIAVHNNQNYSLKYYKRGQSLASEARGLYLNHAKSHRNFFLVTRKRDFLHLKKLRYNSVWQKYSPTDDGSLSVYFAKKNYINVEAGHHQLQSQIQMLHRII
jgi:hypothetical protein